MKPLQVVLAILCASFLCACGTNPIPMVSVEHTFCYTGKDERISKEVREIGGKDALTTSHGECIRRPRELKKEDVDKICGEDHSNCWMI